MPTYKQELQDCLPDLWRYAFALCRDAHIADDLVQDCAERALRKRKLWKPTGPLKPWLFTMLRNIHLNHLRANRSRPNTVTMDNMIREPVSMDAYSERMALSETARALSGLSDDQREVLLLVVLGGVSYKDAATTLEIPIGTLMSRLGRARANLRILTRDADSEGQE